jgi:hypothetical protein
MHSKNYEQPRTHTAAKPVEDRDKESSSTGKNVVFEPPSLQTDYDYHIQTIEHVAAKLGYPGDKRLIRLIMEQEGVPIL